jgi:CRP-like cAMP-binding protein
VQWEILRGLDEPERRAVLARAVRRRYRDHDSLFHQGDPGDSVHLIDKGHVAVRSVSPLGTTLTLDVLAPGSAFGEQSLLDPAARRTASIVAIGAVETLVLEREVFAELRRRFPSVTTVLVEVLAAQVRRLSEQLMDAHSLPAEERVVKQLARLAASFGDGEQAVVPLSQEDLAGLAGTTRPTANRALQRLADRGAVELHRNRIVIPDVSLVAP